MTVKTVMNSREEGEHTHELELKQTTLHELLK